MKNEPNKAVEPTPVDVTVRAFARPAPSTSAAHLRRSPQNMNIRIFALLPFLVSCSTQDVAVDPRPIIPWKEPMISGTSFNSVSDEGILYLGFPAKGSHVAVTIGDRKEAIAAPLWYWTIEKNGALLLTDYSGKKQATLDLIEYSPHEVVVRFQGKIVHYKRTTK